MKALIRLTIAALGLAVFNISAQTPPVLNLQLYAGLTVTGAVGTECRLVKNRAQWLFRRIPQKTDRIVALTKRHSGQSRMALS